MQISEMLTVWRKMHIEVDSMGVPSGNSISGVIQSVSGNVVTTGETEASIGDVAQRFETGLLTQGTNTWPITAAGTNSSGAIKFTVTIASGGQAPAPGFFIAEDDDMQGDVPRPDTSHLASAFARAYVLPVFNEDNSSVTFTANVPDTPSAVGSQIASNRSPNTPQITNDYWSVYLLGAFQSAKSKDRDPDLENPYRLGDTPATATRATGSLVYLETIRDAGKNASWVVAHEIGHYFYGSNHESDGSLMTDGANVTNGSFNDETLMRIRSYFIP
jgi:hypothetical protein